MLGSSPRWAASATASITPWPRTFCSILKVERVYRTSYRTREEAELDLFRFIDGRYNPHRIQRELGWLSPDEYEEAYYTAKTPGSLASRTGAR
jgi:transposase InsO family protein